MIDYILAVVAAQTGLNFLESPALFNDLLDDAPLAEVVYLTTKNNKLRLVRVAASLSEIEDYWWGR